MGPRLTDRDSDRRHARVRRDREPTERLVFLLAILLTIADAAFTYVALATGMVVEANPLLINAVLNLGPAAGMALRAGVGLVLLAVLWRISERSTFARAGMVGVACVLGLLSAYHILGFGGIVR